LSIYGFNLILLPVNLAGAGSSIMQALTGAKGEFKRTPKVRNRTTAPLSFVLLPYAIVALAVYTVVHDYEVEHWTNLAFAAVNAVLGGYAIAAFIGVPNSLVDVWANVSTWLHKPARTTSAGSGDAGPGTLADWALVLHYGSPDPSAPGSLAGIAVAGMDASAPMRPGGRILEGDRDQIAAGGTRTL
jgi:hypothetical protein